MIERWFFERPKRPFGKFVGRRFAGIIQFTLLQFLEALVQTLHSHVVVHFESSLQVNLQ